MKPPPLRISINETIGELWALVDECREWANTKGQISAEYEREFNRLADKLDLIAHRLAEKERT